MRMQGNFPGAEFRRLGPKVEDLGRGHQRVHMLEHLCKRNNLSM